ELVREIFLQLAADFPMVPDYRRELVRSQISLGNLLRELQRPEFAGDFIKRTEIEDAYRDALKVQHQLVADFPTVPQYRQALVRSQASLANVLRFLRQHDDADAAYREALKIRAQLTTDFPTVPEYHYELGQSLNDLAFGLRRPDRQSVNRRYTD